MKAPLLLPISVAAVMSLIFVLPRAGKVAESAIRTDLPTTLGDWQFEKQQPSAREVEVLAKDTDFSKAICQRPILDIHGARINSRRIDLSIVLSGNDINNSIHRPERCMPAQGHQIYDSKSNSLTTSSGKKFPVRELASTQAVTATINGKEETFALDALTFYFFVGRDSITENHLQRALIDMKDRLLHGQDQRWAYVSASMWFSNKGEHGLLSRDEAEKEIRQYLAALADHNIDWSKIKTEPNSP